MLSTPSLHPFLSHFPIALFVAGLAMLAIGKTRNRPALIQAASMNFTLGLLAGILAVFTGMFSTDLGQRATIEVEGHQGYSFAFIIFYTISTMYSYTQAFSQAAYLFYFLNFLLMCLTAISGYALVFHSTV